MCLVHSVKGPPCQPVVVLGVSTYHYRACLPPQKLRSRSPTPSPPRSPWWSGPPSYPISPDAPNFFARGPRLFLVEILATLECCPLLHLGHAVRPRTGKYLVGLSLPF